MKKIIKGKLYDTTTAKELGWWENIQDVRNFSHFSETLYPCTVNALVNSSCMARAARPRNTPSESTRTAGAVAKTSSRFQPRMHAPGQRNAWTPMIMRKYSDQFQRMRRIS